MAYSLSRQVCSACCGLILASLPLVAAAAPEDHADRLGRRASPALIKRGGVAAGDPSLTPTQTSYDEAPPKSTYGPQIAGSTGGFYGLLFGLIVVVAAAALGFCWYRRRRRNRANAASGGGAAFPSAKGARLSGGYGNKSWGKHQVLSGGEEEGMELAGSTDARPWASTASVNLTPGDMERGDKYLDPRYAASGDSLTFDGGDNEYEAVAGGQRAVSPMSDIDHKERH